MTTIRLLILVPVLSAMLAVFSVAAKAAETAAATLVVYRAGEVVSTERLRVAVLVGDERVSRLQNDEAVTTTKPAGTYLISTGIAGADTIEVDLKAGHTHYVRIDLKERAQRLKVALVEVEAQVAQVERPELAAAI